MSIVSYAQNFEDVMLWRAVGDVKQGVYVDVGAQDPVVDSVSKAFYDQGWRGIHIEATANCAARLREARPDEVVMQTAVGRSRGMMAFYEIPNTGLSTGDAAIAKHHRSKGFEVLETRIPCVTLDDVFGEIGGREVHWLKIDVEGMEGDVLAGWRKSAVRPWVLVIESTYPNSQIPTHKDWEAKLLKRGYAYAYFDGLSRYYVANERAELAQRLRLPPNCFDAFTLAVSTPYSAPSRELLGHERQRYERDMSDLRKLHEEHISAAREEARRQLEDLGTQLEQRERDAAASESRASQELDAERAEVRRLLQALAEREEAAGVQLRAAQQQASNEQARLAENAAEALARVRHEAAVREEALQLQLHAAHQHAQKLLGALAQREQELGEQLRAVQAEAAQEKAALVHLHHERELDLTRQLSARETALAAKLLDEAHRQEQLRVELVREHNAQIRALLAEKAEREEDLIREASAAQDAAVQRAQEQSRLHSEQHQGLLHALEAERAAKDAAVQRAQEQSRLHSEQHKGLLHALEAERAARDAAAQRAQEQSRLNAEQHQGLLHALEAERAAKDAAAQRAHEQSRLHAEQHKGMLHALEAERSEAARSRAHRLHLQDRVLELQEGLTAIHQALALLADGEVEQLTRLPGFSNAGASNGNSVAVSLDDLLARDDEQFVDCAYRTLLGRAPDPEGRAYYLERLRAGGSKIRIVSQIHLCPEGAARATRLPGLELAMRQERRLRIPLIGPVLRLVQPKHLENTGAREHRQTQILAGAIAHEVQRRLAESAAANIDYPDEQSVANMSEPVPQVAPQIEPPPTPSQDALPSASQQIQVLHRSQPANAAVVEVSAHPEVLKQLSPAARDIFLRLTPSGSAGLKVS